MVWPGVSPGRRYSGSSLPMISLVHRKRLATSLRGAPRTEAITASGKGPAMRPTKSSSPGAPSCSASPRTSTAMRSMSGRRAFTPRGVKSGLAIRRMGPCRGGSCRTRISVGGGNGAPARRRVIPPALEKRRGSLAMCWTSACLVTAQNGSNPGGSNRARGDSARSRVQKRLKEECRRQEDRKAP